MWRSLGVASLRQTCRRACFSGLARRSAWLSTATADNASSQTFESDVPEVDSDSAIKAVSSSHEETSPSSSSESISHSFSPEETSSPSEDIASPSLPIDVPSSSSEEISALSSSENIPASFSPEKTDPEKKGLNSLRSWPHCFWRAIDEVSGKPGFFFVKADDPYFSTNDEFYHGSMIFDFVFDASPEEKTLRKKHVYLVDDLIMFMQSDSFLVYQQELPAAPFIICQNKVASIKVLEVSFERIKVEILSRGNRVVFWLPPGSIEIIQTLFKRLQPYMSGLVGGWNKYKMSSVFKPRFAASKPSEPLFPPASMFEGYYGIDDYLDSILGGPNDEEFFEEPSNGKGTSTKQKKTKKKKK